VDCTEGARVMSEQSQIAAVLTSPEYLAREPITKTTAARVTGLQPAEALDLLNSMAADGLLIKHKKKESVSYTVPVIRAARVRWRTLTDEQIGITRAGVI